MALAAIMGGLASEVGDDTTEVLLEAANFEPIGILRTSERLGLRTEGSNRWEKGVDPYAAEPAAVLASRLLVDLCGARIMGSTDVHAGLPQRPVTTLRPERARSVIGLDVPDDEQRAILERFGFDVGEEFDVTTPTYRARDVTREIDVIEEVARAVLDSVPKTMPARRHVAGHLSRDQRLRRVVEDVLVGAGFTEAYTWSLRPDDPDPAALRLPEPMSSDQAVLRTTLLDGLIEAARAERRRRRGPDRAVRDRAGLPPVRGAVARRALASGRDLRGRVRRCEGRGRGDLRGAARRAPRRTRRAIRALHPGKSGVTAAGWIGELHPALLEGSWGVFELDLATLFEPIPERILYDDVITFPPVKQDLAVVVADDVEATALLDAIRAAGAPELRQAGVFDVYTGDQVGEGQVSIAFHLAFQSPERTLTDDEVAVVRDRIVATLRERFGAEPRT